MGHDEMTTQTRSVYGAAGGMSTKFSPLT